MVSLLKRIKSVDRHTTARIISVAAMVVICLVFYPFSKLYAGDSPPTPELTLQSGAEIDYPPFSIVDDQGRATGFSVELLRAALGAMNRNVDFRTGHWSKVKRWLEKGELDVLPLVGRTPERDAVFDLTFPYMTLHGAIVIRRDTHGINTLSDLAGRQVAVMKGDNAEAFLRRYDGALEIVTTPTFLQALEALSQGHHDAVVIQRLLAIRLIQELDLKNLKFVEQPVQDFAQDFCFAVKKGDHPTLALLNEGLSLVIADGTFRRLHAKWFAALQLPLNRPIVVGGDRNYPPFEFLDIYGQPAGYNVDLTRAIAREMGLDIEIRLNKWPATIKALKDGTVDIIQGMFFSSVRDETYDFTQPHMLNHYVAIARKGEDAPPENLAGLTGKRILVEEGDIMQEFALQNGLGDQIVTVPDQEAALRMLSKGKGDCALVSRITALYLMDKLKLKNMVAATKPVMAVEYCYSTLNGQDALLAEFGEGLKVLESNEEYRRINQKWFGGYTRKTTSLYDALKYSAMILIPLVMVLLAVLLWSWSLRKQVAKKTFESTESLNRLKYVFEAANVGKSITLPSGEMNANKAFADFLGYTRQELKGKKWQDLTPKEEIGKTEQAIAPLFSGEKDTARFEKRYLHKSGRKVWADVSLVMRRNADNNPLYFVTTVVDITQRKINQSRIEHLNQVLRTMRNVNHLVSHENDKAQLIKKGCRLLVANRGYQTAIIVLTDKAEKPVDWAVEGRVPGYDALLGYLEQGRMPSCYGCVRKVKKVLLINNREGICDECPISIVSSGNQSLCTSLRHGNQTFGYIVVSADSQIILDEEEKALFSEIAGDFAYALEFMKVEAERMHGKYALRESEEKYSTVLENIEAGYYEVDLAGRMFFFNDVMCAILGYSRSELMGMPYQEYMAAEHARRAFQTFNRVYRTGITEKGFDWEIHGKNGEKRYIDATVSLMKQFDGNPSGFRGIARDVTKQKKHEQERIDLQKQLNQAQRMESVGRLAGGVAHDFNNMIGVIMGYAELAIEKNGDDQELQADLTEILNAARRAGKITRQLLAFARRQTIRPEILDLNETVESMLKMLRRLMGEDIELTWHPGTVLWPVHMDPSQIDQILANLCVNARDAIDGVGRVIIETENICLDEAYCAAQTGFKPGEYVLLAVNDNGCGMDKETLDHIFEPFFTTKGASKGTGLGMSTVYGIVKQNKGFISLTSEPGNGTVCKIFLPRHAGDAVQPETGPVLEIPRARGETIMLVEDEGAVRKLTRKMLEELGYHVLEAGIPGEAIKKVQSYANEIHLLLTDVIMPEMNGKDLAEKLVEIFPNIKTLFMSGYTADVIAPHGVLSADVQFIQKPFSKRDMAEKVRKVLDD